jgi:glycosyltransferase involved in cell wall biosynthesis
MTRVLMLVINPMTSDSRVEREAAALARAGYVVTVIATAAPGLPSEEQRDGYTILRRPYRRVVKELALRGSLWERARRREVQHAAAQLGLAGQPGLAVGLRGVAAARRLAVRLRLLMVGSFLRLLRTRLLPIEYWFGTVAELRRMLPPQDVIHAHDLGPLAAAVRLATFWRSDQRQPQVVYDSHELYVEQQTSWTTRERLAWRLHERRWIRHADLIVTVSDGIAAELERRYRLERRPLVVLNASEAGGTTVRDVRTDAEVAPGQLLAVYVGTVKPGRGVDRLIPALAARDGWDLALVGAGDGEHVRAIVEHASSLGVARRLHVLPSMPATTLPSYLRTADVGVHPMEPTCLNHELALPNKLFDYLHAGLPVAVSDLREMASLVRTWQLGTTFDPTEPLAVAAAILDAGRLDRRPLPHELADLVSWRTQEQRLVGAYGRLLLRADHDQRARAGHRG